jgi:hypothetical protein
MNEFNSDYSSVFRILNSLKGDENFEEFNFDDNDLKIIK